MSDGSDRTTWLHPWYPVASDSDEAAAMERRLRVEVAPHHRLFGYHVRTLGRRQDCDDVLFAIEDGTGRVAVVHLTWTSNPPDWPPWPGTFVYESFESWVVERMRPDHDDFFSDEPEAGDSPDSPS